MTDIEKINEELRNYKLFKIQRINVKIQQFSELKSDFTKIKKYEYFNYSISLINIVAIIFLTYLVIKSYFETDYYSVNESLIIFVATIVVIFSIYLAVKNIFYIWKLRKYVSASENAVNHFRSESDNLKSTYESYVDNYLESFKIKRR